MSVLPSPIPHPLDYAPWDVPGWIYEALDWAVGVQWPEGNERAVWDLADRWYAVAAVLAGPHADAAAAATEVRSGYGGVGAVDTAFEAAWRGIAEGDDAPLPVLLAVTADLGRLVEECGCDIEGAKLEVWIELGILVVELLSVAVAAVLTAGAASPAAGAAITATRLVIQQIFKRLMGQLASKALRRGLKEAGERAAKEIAKGGVRGLAKRATREGLEEAAEESGVSLATQAYQNSTGRAHGMDLTDLGASAVGGLAGGAVAPLAGLGRRATGRAARIGEHLGREMTGEMFAESAASIATGQGLTSAEDVVRAAASGATGSATGQTDHALQARLHAQANALAGASFTGPSLPNPTAPAVDVPTPDAAASSPAALSPAPPLAASSAPESPSAASPHAGSPVAEVAQQAGVDRVGSPPPGAPDATSSGVGHGTGPTVGGDPTLSAAAGPAQLPAVAADPTLSAVTAPGLPAVAADPTLSAVPGLPAVAADPTLSAVTAPVAVAVDPNAGPAGTGPAVGASQGVASGAVAPGANGSLAGSPSTGPTPTFSSAAGWSPSTGPSSASPSTPFGPVAGTPSDAVGRPGGVMTETSRGVVTGAPTGRHSAPERFSTGEALAPARVPRQRAARGRAPVPVDVVAFGDPSVSMSERDRYAARWVAEAEAAERRRYQGHYESQRSGFESNRRQAEAARLRARAAEHDRRAVEYADYARQLHQTGHRQWADGWQRAANDETRAYAQWRDLADCVLAGITAPAVVDIADGAFAHANSDVGALALGAVETTGPSRLTGDDVPPPIDDSRPYGQPGGLRPPLALHQVDVERQMPRERDGAVLRTADPRRGGWFRLLNDGGPQADATRGINCLDCTLSLFETWVHGRPRVSAPRTFDGYLDGDTRRPIRGEAGGPGRVEDVTGGRFQRVLTPPAIQQSHPAQARQAADRGYANLHDQLLLGGHGSYAFLITEWAGGGSHAWVALNQNGTVLYVDPQTGLVRDRPLYPDVVGIDALVLGGDGRPMPLGGLPRGRFSERPDLPYHPPAQDDGGHGDPYINRMYLLLDGPGSVDDPGGSSSGPVGEEPTGHRDPARVLALANGLDEVFSAGVSPSEFARAADPPTLRRLVPNLDDADARDVSRLFADARVRDMLDTALREPPPNEPNLAVHLALQLAQAPDLARIILGTPELAASLTARPLTLHHLASHQQAIDALADVLDDITQQETAGPGATDRRASQPQPTPLTDEQRRISASIQVPDDPPTQPGFDSRQRGNLSYRKRYLDDLYSAAALAQLQLNQLATSLAQVGDRRVGEPGWRTEPKNRRRAEDKVNKYGGDPSKLLDLAAAKIEFRRLDDLYDTLQRMRDRPDVMIIRCQDRFISPEDSGYRDVQLVLRTGNGHLAEFRLHLAALDTVAVWEHALYEVRRDVDAVARAEGRAMNSRESAITDGILRREQQLFWEALQSTYEGNA
ncbi:toxin glutamine deamidase domain-containing protein [Micromonospora lupini]|uniref:toxin glutamine deamidase domain-containing protein n=1 Tax=Micromonospora lupini TaxID=285679 RepID=UPI00224EA980|nr:toxin glutamine deamidase domain-containing protein [Micromonospora lupini]MCX5069361.1 toxin glutamine deamidase domain-containing protein [Micromonospora lupini]